MIDFEDFARAAEAKLGEDALVTIGRAARADFPGDPKRSANLFIASLGFQPIHDRWEDLTKFPCRHAAGVDDSDPRNHLAATLMNDLVFSCEWLSAPEAESIARQFYSYFDRGVVTYLSNRIANGWDPITKSTLEAAYVVVDDVSIGVFILEAED